MAKNNGFDENNIEDEFTLESILAEYKGSAYISGDKKTPSDILNAKTQKIILEETGALPEVNDGADIATAGFDSNSAAKEEKISNKNQDNLFVFSQIKDSIGEKEKHKDDVEDFFDHFSSEINDNEAESKEEPEYIYSNVGSAEKFAGAVSSAIDKETELNDAVRKSKFFSFIKRNNNISDEDDQQEEIYSEEEPEEVVEPNFIDEARRFLRGTRSLSIRMYASFIICLISLIFTLVFEAQKALPFGLSDNILVLSGVLLIMQLVVMILSIDILISGFADIIHACPGGESLLTVSSIVTAMDGIIMLATENTGRGLPLCVISAAALFFALRGKKLYRLAMADSLLAAAATTSPYGVVSDFSTIEDRSILKKVPMTTKGFYTKLTESDVCESCYNKAAPMLAVAAFIFSFLTSLVKSSPEYFAYSFAIMLAVSASFSMFIAYNLPFRIVSKRAKHSGGAIAGWAGASDIFFSDGALITDEDLFPVGSLSLNDIKVFEGMSQQKAITYTASLIIASGAGLSRVFSDLLKSKSYHMAQIEDFSCYEGGGVGAVINGERVLAGSAGFMNLMGVRISDTLSAKNAVYTTINDELVAIFTINYVPANSVQKALVGMLKTKFSMLFAVRDFNVTPLMVQQKFKISMDGIEYIPIEDCYRISEEVVPKGSKSLAVLCREGLGPFAEVITRGKQLKIISEMTTAISVIGSVIGLLMMFFLCWSGAYGSASAGSLFLYMFTVQAAVLILARLASKRN